MRWVTALVLPVPAPASTHTGPRLASTTCCCSGSRAASRASGPASGPSGPAIRSPEPVSAVRCGAVNGSTSLPNILAYDTDAAGNRAHGLRVSYARTRTVTKEMWTYVAAADYVHHPVVRVLPAVEEPASPGRHRDDRG